MGIVVLESGQVSLRLRLLGKRSLSEKKITLPVFSIHCPRLLQTSSE